MNWARIGYGIDDLDGEPVVVRAEVRGRRVVTETVSPASVPVDGLRGNRGVCNAALSVRESFTHLLDAPFPRGAKARKVLPTLLDIQIPFPLEECAYAFVGKRKGDARTTRVLAVGARRAEVRKKLKELAGRDVDPNLLDHEGLALWTQAGRERPAASPDGLRVVLRLGRHRSTMVVGQGRRYLASHGIRAGDNEQIARLARAHLEKGRQLPQGVGGDGESVEWLCAGVAVEDRDFTERVRRGVCEATPGSLNTLKDPATFLARALAVRALGVGPLRCNLRSGVMEHSATLRQTVRRSRAAAALFLVGGLCLCAGALLAEARLRADLSQTEAAFRTAAERLAGLPLGGAKGEHALRMAAARADEQKERLRPFLDALRPSLTRRIVDVMTLARSSGLRLDVVAITPEEISIRGKAPSWQACDGIVGMLRESGYPAVLDRHGAREDKWIPFTIRK
jgi:hypothetical protein